MIENNVLGVSVVKQLNLENAPKGEITRSWVQLASDGISWPIAVPVMIARGMSDGPVVGITAAVHGNELNGLPVIQRLFSEIDVKSLRGTVVGVLVVNVPGLHLEQRNFNDGVDLNHIMPGKADGNNSEIYVSRLMDRLVRHFNYLIDLHTASFGRINSYYIRADMDDETTRKMALLQNADIIVHNPPRDGTLRGAAEDLGIASITLEVGDPHRFQKGMIRSGLTGIYNFLSHFGMIDDEIEVPEQEAVICQSSKWIYTQKGGILVVPPELTTRISKGDQIGTLRNVFGDVINHYIAPFDGIVIGKSVNPVNQSGGRILHLGALPSE